MRVIKIGGSLQETSYLTEWLDIIVRSGSGSIVIVPGGGKFADEVRRSQLRHGFDDISAHKMALLAMEKYARLFKEMAPELQLVRDIKAIHNCLANRGIAVWLPYKMVAGDHEVPPCWEVTSDGLAVWLAIKLQFSSVILVKSVPMPTDFSTYEELAVRGLIDPFLVQLHVEHSVEISWMEKSEAELLPAVLQNREFKLLDNYVAGSPGGTGIDNLKISP